MRTTRVKSVGNPAGIGKGTGFGLRERERDGIGLGLYRLRAKNKSCHVKELLKLLSKNGVGNRVRFC